MESRAEFGRLTRRRRFLRAWPLLGLGLWALLLPSGSAHAQSTAFPGSVVLGRPTDHSVTANVVADEPMVVYVEFGPADGGFTEQTPAAEQAALAPYEAVLDGLAPDQSYHYRLRYRRAGASEFAVGEALTFRTQRSPGQPFTFVMQADSHMDEQSDVEVYRQALRNQAADQADFLVDLGDTFFSEKFAKTEPEVIDRHLLQRPLLGMVARSAPLFLTLGNHEGESGSYLNGSDQNLAVWATRARQKYYPNPFPDDFYSGDRTFGPFVGQREAYFAWTWGDALFMVLDPFWNTTDRPKRAGTNWAWTLGEDQYRWMVQTLEASAAPYKFVLIHNLVGGVGYEGRGGVEAAPYYEWGGHNADGSWGFDTQRPGWGRPIHQVFVDTGVSALFHGHDHLFAKQDLDGIVYQEVPQPSHPRGGTSQATDPAYRYLSGDILGSSGHLRVRVAPDLATIEYVRAYRADDPRNGRRNGTVDYRYQIRPRGAPTPAATVAAPTATASPAPTHLPEAPARLYLPRLLRQSPDAARTQGNLVPWWPTHAVEPWKDGNR